MTVNRFEQFAGDFEKKLGVQAISDLQYVTVDDLGDIGFLPVQKRRFLQLTVPSGTAPPPPPKGGPSLNDAPPITTHVTVVEGGGSELGKVPAVTSPTLRVVRRRDADEADSDYEEAGETDGDDGDGVEEDSSVVRGAHPVTKRRRTLPSLLRRARDEEVRAAGGGRTRLPTQYPNRTTTRSLSSEGTSRHTRDADGSCSCKSLLLSYMGRFAPARRSAQERRLADMSGDRKGGQSVYNYARLGPIVVDILFDARGNHLVHESCAREVLGVSNTWLASRHKQAVRSSQEPTVHMTKSEIASSPNAERLISRILRPDTCLLSITQYFSSSPANQRFEVVSSHTEHGLSGMPSNRMKLVERKLFQEFVCAHRTPSGRTPDKNGRFHGAAYYLDGKWTVLRASNNDDERVSFASGFNEALAAAGLTKVHVDVPRRWLRELSGRRGALTARWCPRISTRGCIHTRPTLAPCARA